MNRTEANYSKVYAQNVRALACIRSAMSPDSSKEAQDDLLIATSFLYLAEVMLGNPLACSNWRFN